jgi:hypothetical protein
MKENTAGAMDCRKTSSNFGLFKNTFKKCGAEQNFAFPPSTQMYDWVRKPYSDSSAQHKNLTFCEEEELCELQSDLTVKIALLL